MHEQERQHRLPLGLGRVRFGVDEVDVEAVDSGLEVVERVQLGLLLAPVVLGQPVVAHDLRESICITFVVALCEDLRIFLC